jgi:arylsulfatase A-like enzyme
VISSTLRRLVRDALAFFIAPPVCGMIYLLTLAAWAGTRSGSVVADVGDVRRAEAMESFMTRRFASEITRMKVGVVATAIAFGLVVGLIAEGLLRLRHSRWSLEDRTLRRAALESVLLVVAVHATFVVWAMADTPQLYASEWYAYGGAARTVQVIVTDLLGPRWVLVLALLAVGLYVGPGRIRELGGLIAEKARHLRGMTARASMLVLFTLALAAIGHDAMRVRDAHAESEKSEKMNVLILAADSLRADRLDPRIAPHLTELAARATRFDRAYVSLPRTFPSWVTILTGRHAHHHGVRSMFPTWEDRAKDFDALPARFAKAGWSTAVVSDYAGDIFGRIDLGFGTVDTPGFDFRQVVRQKVLERETPLLPLLHSHMGRKLFPVMRELASAADPMLLADDIDATLSSARKPFFMTAFFSTAHFPYAAPAPYYAKYTDPAYRGRYKYHKPLGLGSAAELQPDADDIKQIQALYDGAVTAIDDAIARVLHSLERLGIADRTIIVVTADHGETLFDHGHGQGHGDHLFGDEAIHVPLLVYDPRVAKGGGRRVDRIVRDVDIAPTLYELAGIESPGDLDGQSFAPALTGAAISPRLAYAESELWFTEDIPSLAPELRMPYPGVVGLTEIDSRHNAEIVLRRDMFPPTLMARHRMVRDERFKLLYIPTRLGVRYMLFDSTNDADEVVDVAGAMPAEVARLKAELWSWMLKDPLMEQRDGFLVPREGRAR